MKKERENTGGIKIGAGEYGQRRKDKERATNSRSR